MYSFNHFLSTAGLVFSVMLLVSCESPGSPEIEQSVAFIESTVPIPEAQNVTMDLRSGRNSGALHLIELSNIQTNPFISNGVKKSWCIEWDVSSIQGLQRNVKLHSTEGKAYWNKLNYLLNRIDELKQEHPGLTYKEIQIAIWSVVDYKPFNIDDIPGYSNFPSDFYKDGSYFFDVSLSKELVKLAKNNAGTSPGPVFAIVVENEGQIVITASEN